MKSGIIHGVTKSFIPMLACCLSLGVSGCKPWGLGRAPLEPPIKILPERTLVADETAGSGKTYDYLLPYARTVTPRHFKAEVTRNGSSDDSIVSCVSEDGDGNSIIINTPTLDSSGVMPVSWPFDYEAIALYFDRIARAGGDLSGFEPEERREMKSLTRGSKKVLPFVAPDACGYILYLQGDDEIWVIYLWDLEKKRNANGYIISSKSAALFDEKDVFQFVAHWKWIPWSGGADIPLPKESGDPPRISRRKS